MWTKENKDKKRDSGACLFKGIKRLHRSAVLLFLTDSIIKFGPVSLSSPFLSSLIARLFFCSQV